MKFLADAQASALFVPMLKGIGWQIETAHEHGLGRFGDDQLVAWAREHNYVLVTFDKLRGQTGARVARELNRFGGKVIMIGGGPEQAPERAVGRLLFHYPEWYPWLEKNEGIVIVSDLRHGCRLLPASEMHSEVQATGRRAFDPYLQRRAQARQSRPPRRRPRRVPPEQGGMDLCS